MQAVRKSFLGKMVFTAFMAMSGTLYCLNIGPTISLMAASRLSLRVSPKRVSAFSCSSVRLSTFSPSFSTKTWGISKSLDKSTPSRGVSAREELKIPPTPKSCSIISAIRALTCCPLMVKEVILRL